MSGRPEWKLTQARHWLNCVALVLAFSGCATGINYNDPAGPVFTGPQTIATRASTNLRVVTFNIKFAEHMDRAADLLTRPGPLKDADVLLLQEMDAPSTESLARTLGMNYVYVPAVVHQSTHRDFGVAILSPWRLDDPRKVLLPHPHRFRKNRRTAAAATMHAPSGDVRVFAVHFETPFGGDGAVRRNQARAVADVATSFAGPVVIAGDFNGTAGAHELERLGFTWLTRDVHNTTGLFDFDHILVRGLCPTARPPAAKAPDVTNASDHVPVWTTLQPCPMSK